MDVRRGMEVSYIKYADFDAAYRFSERCGFQLTDVQIKDVETFVGWKSSLNSGEVGVGKTCMSTVVSLMRKHRYGLVVVPPILIRPWVQWLNKVSERVCPYRGTPAQRKELQKEEYHWYVMSHTILRMDFAWCAKKFKTDTEIIVDEAHALKNPASKLFQEIQLLGLSQSNNVQLLTGTPVSKPLDVYAYVKLNTPEVYRSYAMFENIHVTERNFFKQPVAYGELEMLASNLALRSIGRSKEFVHGYNLTPLYPDSTYELSPEHMKLYEKLLDEQLLLFDDGSKIDATSVSKLTHAMQQIIVNYDYFSNDPTKRSVAYDLVDMTIEDTQCADITRSKLIIWCKYRLTSGKMLAYCNSLGIKTVAAYGDSNADEAVRLFMDDPETRILIGQPQSCGAGLNCQEVCSEALFIEYDTTSLLSRQACGRIVRVGQKRKPTLRFAVAAGTVQERLLQQLLTNDDMVTRIEPSKKGLREMLLGG